MCVIAIKPRKKKIDLHTVELMYTANPHGAGFAVVTPRETIVSKGYFDVGELWDDINRCQDEQLVIHFRWATHGATSCDMTHPFIVDSDINIATQNYVETYAPVFFHNGIIHGFGDDKHVSDTCDFALNILAPMQNIKDMTRLLDLLDSKFALVQDGKIHMIGGFEKYKGLRVSNTFFDMTRSKTHGNTIPFREISYNDPCWDNDSPLFSRTSNSIEEGESCFRIGGSDEDRIDAALSIVSKRCPKAE